MANVLVVDDREQARGLLTNILTRGGHSAMSVEHPDPELYQMDLSTTDLLIVDLGMETRGEEIIYTLRSSGIQVPILVLSGMVEEVDEVPLRALGADRVLAKPCSAEKLLETVLEILS